MERTQVKLPEMKLLGLSVRTNNADELKPEGGKIKELVQDYFSKDVASLIPHRKRPGVTYCAYIDYESDHNGPYTFFIGEQVTKFDEMLQGLEAVTIEPQSYVKHTAPAGPMPLVVMAMWQEIWEGGEKALGGKRRFHADFEVYDERAADPQNTVLDIYIGIMDKPETRK